MINYREQGNLSTGATAAGTVVLEALRAELGYWLQSSDAIVASGDAGFSDDGEAAPPSAAAAKLVKPLRPAAVLVLVVAHPIPTVLFTLRTAHLTDHAGQISFPGGRVEDTDRDAAHTALREAHEETGVDAKLVAVIGHLPQYTTGTGYLITPVVGLTHAPLQVSPDPIEVDECFEVPLAFLLDARNHRREQAMYKGRLREYFAIPYEKRYIWGATAGMLVTLSRVVAHARGGAYEGAVKMALDGG